MRNLPFYAPAMLAKQLIQLDIVSGGRVDIEVGTGLGLYLSHDIVTNRHNGSIEVASAPGNTVFTVRLPLS